ncbi:MAG: ATP-binding protein, partial [Lachnospiraceae bacterium]|nr:ATP-binding protein [Lachnospiraceae bacterium]
MILLSVVRTVWCTAGKRLDRGMNDMNTWTMHVEKFGKIESADIEVAPMTLFVGDNNSGKSYIMTLIYGLIN